MKGSKKNITKKTFLSARCLTLYITMLISKTLPYAQLSPGELTTAHEKLEGLSNCTQCHVLGKKVTNQKCLDCHTEINKLIENKKGYHASNEVSGKECYVCHNEHHGRHFQIVRLDEDKFDHTLTGFALEGKHKTIDCNQCHKQKLIKQKISKKSADTYLGLGSDCLSCHTDYHQGTLSGNCVSCHTMEAFSPASKFSHQSARFRLKGKHTMVNCSKCHKVEIKNEVRFQRFSNIPFENCTSCHIDVHDNKFGQDCKKCHSEESFVSLQLLKNFDHNKTGYVLKGKHAEVDCKSCHKQSFTKMLPHNSCTDCHSDYHKGQLKTPGKVYSCNQCHTVSGFSPSSYTLEKHQTANFILTGAHEPIPCFSCHVKNNRWEFRNVGLQCFDCHENIHKNHITEKYYPNGNCKVCHNVETWKKVSFEHEKTGFELKGKHAEASCRNCHFDESNPQEIQQNFKNVSAICVQCHQDIHRNQFETDGMVFCNRCHEPENWKSVLFNHDSARFKLEGAHVNVDCVKCHTTNTDEKGTYVVYKFNNEKKCIDCHIR